jgi:hypothetical protein
MACPFSGKIPQARHANAPRQPSIDCGLNQRRCEEGKGNGSVDLPDTVFLARCDLLNFRDRSRYQLIEPMPPLRDRSDELGAGFGAD